MAHTILRSSLTKLNSLPVRLGQHVGPLNLTGVAAVCQIQVAGLRATFGGQYPYEKPWPYETKKYNFIHEWLDNTKKRLNENSKVIIVEGNVGVGKNAFAERLAKNFDLKLFKSVPDADCFKHKPNGFDTRALDECLPKSCQSYDLRRFLEDPHPERGTVGRLQLEWYYERFLVYAKALQHLLNTGQGVVLVRSAYGDQVMIDALRKLGYITRNFNKYYYEVRDNTICELLKPHITIYLDAPINVLMDRIRQRNNPLEVNSKIMNEDYLQAIKWAFEHRFLDKMRRSGEVLEIDWTEVADDMDMEVIVEEMQRLQLEADDIEDTRFDDWTRLPEDDLCHYRKVFGSSHQLETLFNFALPWDCPEVMLSSDDADIFRTVMKEHPALRFTPGWAKELGHNTLFKM